MIAPGYYDISFPVEEWENPDLNPSAPSRTLTEKWLGARVLMVDGADLLVEHYPAGWKGVIRRIDRVSPEWAKSMTFKPVEVPNAC